MKTDNLSRSLRVGMLLLEKGFSVEAEPFLEQAVCQERGFLQLMSLGICKRHLAKFAEAECLFDSAEDFADEKDVGPAMLWSNVGMLAEDVGSFSRATAAYKRAHELMPIPNVSLNYATALMREGRWEEAWPLWEKRPFKSAAFPNLPEWKGQDLAGKKILICREGGFGDAIMFLRWFKDLKERGRPQLHGAHIAFWVWDSLIPLLEGHPWIDELLPASGGLSLLTEEGKLRYDYQIRLMSLPAALNLSDPVEKLSYIPSHSPRVVPPCRVGFCWRSEEEFVVRKHRSLTDDDAHGVAESFLELGWTALIPGHPFLPSDADWKQTAELIADCELVISVDTAVAHLAGAMGKETWLLLPMRSDWKWGLPDKRFDWYPNVRIFQQTDPISWENVINEVKEALIERQGTLSR